MSKLRKATEADFKDIKPIYMAIKYQCLWKPVKLKKRNKEKVVLTEEQKRDLEFIHQLGKIAQKEYENYLISDFQNDLRYNNVFVYEDDDNKIVGYFIISNFKRGVWRIKEWGLTIFKPDERLKMLKKLEEKKTKSIHTIEFYADDPDGFYEKHEFSKVSAMKYQKSI